jgi:uncharacterized 2Fe-2S/4Fe-4S cluster protein (DUF4445 family)
MPVAMAALASCNWRTSDCVRLTGGDSSQALSSLPLAAMTPMSNPTAAGIHILLARLGAAPSDVSRVYLAGAFGNYVNRESARRIGLFDFPLEAVSPVGNTALSGARLALFDAPDTRYKALRRRIEHVPLASDPAFQETYVAGMPFPGD